MAESEDFLMKVAHVRAMLAQLQVLSPEQMQAALNFQLQAPGAQGDAPNAQGEALNAQAAALNAEDQGWETVSEDEESGSEDEAGGNGEPQAQEPTIQELMEAVMNGDLESLENWRPLGVINANQPCPAWQTRDECLLTLALSYKRPKVVQKLLADTHEISADLLFDCVRGRRSLSLIKFLVQNRKVNFTIEDPYRGGNTILHELVEMPGMESAALMCYFIQAGCDINIQNNRLRSPIHLLLFPPSGMLDYPNVHSINLSPFLLNIRSLILAGCNMELTDYNNYTPLDYLLLVIEDYPRLKPLGEKILRMMAKAGVDILKITENSEMANDTERPRRVKLVKEILKKDELHTLEVELTDREKLRLDSALNELFDESPCDLKKMCKPAPNQLDMMMDY